MKTVLIYFISALCLTSLNAQNSIETQSVALEDLITFIANSFPLEQVSDTAKAKTKSDAQIKPKQISFVLETSKNNFSPEDRIVLQQAFKFLSTRLQSEDSISLFVYSGQNGLLLDRVLVKEIKKIMLVINDVRSNIIKKHKDGISMTYQFAEDNFNNEADNMVVIVRNPNATESVTTPEIEATAAKQPTSKNAVENVALLTAITLLPELISVIKD